jgi:hypothetical protein
MMLRTSVIAIALLLTAAGAALAQSPPQRSSAGAQGTDPERAACHPDVVKFCRQLLKDNEDADVFAILDCLQTNRPKISSACRQVLASHGQ